MQQLERPRIGYVVKRYPRYSETFIVNEILAHEAAGLEVEIFSLRGPEDTHFQDIISRVRAPVTFLPDRVHKTTEFWSVLREAAASCPGIWSDLADFADIDPREVAHGAALATLVVQRGITHLHAHFATSATTAARIASRVTGVPYSFTAHAKDIFHESVDPDDLAGKFRDALAVVTVSDFNQDYLGNAFPAARNKIRRIYNGLDLVRFPFASPRDRRPTIVSVGRLVEKKGFEYLIEACAELRRRSVDFQCQIIGSGEREAALRDLIARHALGSHVEMLGSRPQREVIELVQSAAVFAAPCVVGADGNRDGLPTVLLEAMALGTPCVGTDVTGIPEALIDGQTGSCIAQRDTNALVAQLERLLEDPELRVALATGARRRIERLFDVETNAAAVRDLFEPHSDRPVERQTA